MGIIVHRARFAPCVASGLDGALVECPKKESGRPLVRNEEVVEDAVVVVFGSVVAEQVDGRSTLVLPAGCGTADENAKAGLLYIAFCFYSLAASRGG